MGKVYLNGEEVDTYSLASPGKHQGQEAPALITDPSTTVSFSPPPEKLLGAQRVFANHS